MAGRPPGADRGHERVPGTLGITVIQCRPRDPEAKPRVERAVQYVRGNFFADEHFTGLSGAQARAEAWYAEVAGMRIYGTFAARPAEVFAEQEAGALVPLSLPYDVPLVTRVISLRGRDLPVEGGNPA